MDDAGLQYSRHGRVSDDGAQGDGIVAAAAEFGADLLVGGGRQPISHRKGGVRLHRTGGAVERSVSGHVCPRGLTLSHGPGP